MWLSLKPKTNSSIQFWKSLLKEANPLQIISALLQKLHYTDLCIWRMLLFCKAPNASIIGKIFTLNSSPSLKNFSSLQFCTFLILRIGVEENCIKIRSNLIFFKRMLTVTSDGFNEYFFPAILTRPILQGKPSELVSKFCTGIWTIQAVGRQLRRNLFLVLNKLSTEKYSHVGSWIVLSATAAGFVWQSYSSAAE